MNYVVKAGGTYKYMSELTTYRDTGRTETVANPNRKWFQLWKPRMITRPLLEMVRTDNAEMIGFFAPGDVIPGVTVAHRLTGPINR